MNLSYNIQPVVGAYCSTLGDQRLAAKKTKINWQVSLMLGEKILDASASFTSLYYVGFTGDDHT